MKRFSTAGSSGDTPLLLASRRGVSQNVLRQVNDYGAPLQFGSFITPAAADSLGVVALAVASETAGLDLVCFQDDPYQSAFLHAWTLMSFVAARTDRIQISASVHNLPLRPPAVLARAAASLDLLSAGRYALALGAGASGTPSSRWEASAAAPAPAHPIPVWLGAYGPRMLRIVGTLADGWLPSMGPLARSPRSRRATRASTTRRRMLGATLRRFGEQTAPAARQLVAAEGGIRHNPGE